MADATAAAADTPRWLFVSGLGFEARIAIDTAGVAPADALHGLRGDALTAALEARLREPDGGARTLISFGVAGGIADALRPGSIVIADAVIAGGAAYHTDPGWRAALRAALPDAVGGTLLADDEPVLDVDGKRQRHLDCGALAVDMESHRVARLAHLRGRPLVVCRVIADPAERAVPPAALAAMGPHGDIALGAMLRSLLARPGQIAMLPRLAVDAALARRSLRRAARALAHCQRGDYGAVVPAGG